MTDAPFTPGEDVLLELTNRIQAEIASFLRDKEPDATDLPEVTRSKDLGKADFTVPTVPKRLNADGSMTPWDGS